MERGEVRQVMERERGRCITRERERENIYQANKASFFFLIERESERDWRERLRYRVGNKVRQEEI